MFKQGERLDFSVIDERAKFIANFIKEKEGKIINTLLYYETYQVAVDEIERTLDLLTSLSENAEYFKERIGRVVTFLPSNQPLYAFFCFAVIPSFIAEEVYVQSPEVMKEFFFDLMDILEIEDNFSNIRISEKKRADFLEEHTVIKLNKETNARYPVTDAVIFTGTMDNADKIRKLFHPSTLFIANGSGHNPIVITESGDINKAIESILRLQLYNSGQDCAAPNAILTHKDQIDFLLLKLRQLLSKVKIGSCRDLDVIVGPINQKESLFKIQKILLDNARWLDESTKGIIHVKNRIVEPTIIVKPLKEGGNYIETFAPIFFLQEYDIDEKLSLYFENPKYGKSAMYITVFGHSPYIEKLVGDDNFTYHDESSIIINTDLHAPGIERGTQPYGGYGRGASCLSISGKIIAKPTLPQRDIYEHLVKPQNNMIQKKEKGDIMQTNHQSKQNRHWSEVFADRVIEKFPDKEVYTFAAGISPSGIVHFGNLRDVITSFAVCKELQKRGKRTRIIFSWDDFDRFRKVPNGIDSSFVEYIGLPLTKVPCPDGKYSSYAEKFEKEFEEAMQELGIELEYRYQTQEYTAGKYDYLIIHALQNRLNIADTLLSFMSESAMISKSIKPEEYREEYYPVIVYSRFTGKDNTRVLDYDGGTMITYKCFDTGKTETVDITEHRIVKLSWKIDWPMRWKYEGVVFEPGGHDHASPGGSYDTSSKIAREIFNIEPPIFQEYKFVGIQGLGAKMSGSKGNAISPKRLLEIYTPELLKWLYFRRRPNQNFALAFDSEINRQYSELDQEVLKFQDNKEVDEVSLKLSGIDRENLSAKKPIPFRQSVAFGQIIHWDKAKLMQILSELSLNYDMKSTEERLPRAKVWLETYNPEEMITLFDQINLEYASTIDDEDLSHIQILKEALVKDEDMSIQVLEKLLYSIPKKPGLEDKENAKLQRHFFKVVYNLLIGKDTGPRLSTFIWAAGHEKVIKLLDI